MFLFLLQEKKTRRLHLVEITTKAVQVFVAYLASGGQSRETVETVLLTLSSLLKTARAWGYACSDFRFADLTLPREGESGVGVAKAPENLKGKLVRSPSEVDGLNQARGLEEDEFLLDHAGYFG